MADDTAAKRSRSAGPAGSWRERTGGAGRGREGVDLIGPDGLLKPADEDGVGDRAGGGAERAPRGMTSTPVEGRNGANSRNGKRAKPVVTERSGRCRSRCRGTGTYDRNRRHSHKPCRHVRHSRRRPGHGNRQLGPAICGTQYSFSLGSGQSMSISLGPSSAFGGCNTCLTLSGSTITGFEGDGLVQFTGTFSSLNWTGANPEFWNESRSASLVFPAARAGEAGPAFRNRQHGEPYCSRW